MSIHDMFSALNESDSLNESVSDNLIRDLFKFSAKVKSGLVKIESEPVSCNYMSSPATPIFYLDGTGVSKGQFILSAPPGTRNSRFVFLCGFSEDGDRYYQKVKEIGVFDLSSDDNYFGSHEVASLVKTLIRVIASSAKRRDNTLIFDRSLAANFNRIFSGYTLGESVNEAGKSIYDVLFSLAKRVPNARDLFLPVTVVQTKRGRKPEWGIQWKIDREFFDILRETGLLSYNRMVLVKPYYDAEWKAEQAAKDWEIIVDRTLGKFGLKGTKEFLNGVMFGDREATYACNRLVGDFSPR